MYKRCVNCTRCFVGMCPTANVIWHCSCRPSTGPYGCPSPVLSNGGKLVIIFIKGLLDARRFHSFTGAFYVHNIANMRLSVGKCVFCFILIISCGYANAGNIVKRQSGGQQSALSRLVQTIISGASDIPLVGGQIAEFLEWLVRVVDVFEIGTNGAIARLLGGALPCTVSLSGTSCSGLTNNGGFGKVLMSVLNGIPSILLPGFVKSLLKLSIEMFADPIADVLFGGVVVNAKQ
ncbi:uncharacterized protein [Venturia canescens]|uniref:uncharacterized protein isoform X2 n=1 Tax=Venturia canescens TaxID=32260 RepID=UPI001C9D01C1|nr:uncharacterized protein LOC122415837 isoform X2 [Venturia canescens]